jgi:hypothetical protein
MARKVVFASLIFTLLIALVACRPANSAPRPLTKGELLALVAGQSLPENIVSEIRSYGVSFTCDDKYTGLLKAASVDPRILAALHSAKAMAGAPPEGSDDSAVLQHLSNAGRMIHAGQLDDATIELSASLNARVGKPKPDSSPA